MTNRTQEQIVARIKSISDEDFFGWQTNDLLEFLDYEHAKAFIKDEVTAEKWAEVVAQRKTPQQLIVDYLPFAWGKANDCRGISAGRSLEHMKAWLWLAGEDELLSKIEDDYQYYGKPHLVKISEHFALDWKALDNNCWVNDESEEGVTAEEALA